MGFYNRPYLRNNPGSGDGGSDGGYGGRAGSGLSQFGFSKPTPAVLGLMIACFSVFMLGLIPAIDDLIYRFFPLSFGKSLEVWRFLTFQFVHASAGHIMWNMVGLYFFGPPLERLWGSRKFLAFYLMCGVFAGLCFDGLVITFDIHRASLVGASGGILGLLAGCAILIPSMLIFFFPIRIAAVFFALLYFLSVLHDRNLSDGAHLGGMIMAGLWIWGESRLGGGRFRIPGLPGGKLKPGAWEKKMAARRKAQAQIDEILQKIHEKGIASLSRKERKTLEDASRRQKEEDSRYGRL